MLDKNNRGLSYIRQLVLWDDGELSREPTEQYEYPEAALLVYLLPKDILTNFQ